MSFSAEWLALREPHDMRARNTELLDAVTAAFEGRQTLSVVDLGSGTGSTVRALSSRLPKPQHWTLVDNDPVLLAEAFAATPSAGVMIETRQFDLNDDVAQLFDGADLISTSALLDLVSEPWLANLAAAAAARALPVYAALSYDGRARFSTSDPFDEQIVSAVNAHQRRNKGFGSALGPRAATAAERIFRALGYTFIQGRSDWVATPADVEFQLELLGGWRQAAEEMAEAPREVVDGWYLRRCEAVKAGMLALDVGHVDFFAQPAKP